MKKFIIIFSLILLGTQALWATVTVDGFCYLDGETDHSGTKVLFEAVTPSAVTDSTYTNTDGSFNIDIAAGVYHVYYSHESWMPYTIPEDVICFSNITLPTYMLVVQGIEVSGPQSGVWSSGYYNVIGDISVNNGDTLIIQPSVTVKFMDYYTFYIYGKLIAAGTEADTIHFTSGQPSGQPNPNPGDWKYIRFETNYDSNSIISYAKIEYAHCGISCSSSSPSISNNTIINNNLYGIFCWDSSPTISNNTISNNSDDGIYCTSSSSPSISNNTIINNNSDGIYCISSSPTLSNNTISNNSDDGILCSQSFSIISNNIIYNNDDGIHCHYSSLNIRNNTIYNNNDDGINCDNSSPNISNNTICTNYYGIYCDDNSTPTILNNILYDNNIGIEAESSPSSVEHNLFWLNSNSGSLPPYFGQIITVNANGDSCDSYYNLFQEPLFVNPANLDFHITENSPCIDAGDPDSPLDPDGTIADMGAFYFNQGTITPPVAEFEGVPLSGESPHEVDFTDESIPGTYAITSWEWDFDNDGTVDSYDQNPEWTYEDPGTYTVSLTVSDGLKSDNETKVGYIEVSEPSNIINIPEDYATIQEGINAANESDTVLVAAGTYTENITWPATNGIKLIGSGEDDCIIDGNQQGSVIRFEEDLGGIINTTTLFTGFTIQNGSAQGSSPSARGGGIFFTNSSPTLTNVTISANSAESDGGGIYCNDSDELILIAVTITGNTANLGGGIYCDNSSPTLTNVSITGNSASDKGSGIHCISSSSPTLTNVSITGNNAVNEGGGINIDNAYATLTNTIIWGNNPDEILLFVGTVNVIYSNIQGGEEGIVINFNGTIYWGEGNIDIDPLFVDPIDPAQAPTDEGNFYLQPDSPCIDAGDPETPLDLDGTIADMGAFYFDQGTITPPVAEFEGVPLSGESPHEVDFTDESTPGTYDITSWEWDFENDGTIDSYEKNPNWVYTEPDFYTVSLTVSDGLNYDTETKVDYIEVSEPSNIINIPEDYATIQEGINAATVGDTIIVQPGTYVENINYNGKNITVGSLFLTTQDTTYISQTIIDGNQNGSVVTFSNGEDSTTVLSGFTVTNGNGTNDGTGSTFGGGIYCSNQSGPTISNCIIRDNITTGVSGDGGGIYCYVYSSPIINNCFIINNYANDNGGGIRCIDYSSPTIINCTITDNSAVENGGGINCRYESNPIIENCFIENNEANFGGGINCFDNSSPTITNCTINGNTAINDGGGIWCGDSSSPSISDCIIDSNSSSHGGGVYCDNSSNPYIIDCTISNNSALGNQYSAGGGIDCNNNSNPSLENVSIFDNISTLGGGFHCSNSSPTLINVTITGNSADLIGGGIECYDNSSPTITECIINNNTSAQYGGGITCHLNSSPTIINCSITNNEANNPGGGIRVNENSSPIITNCIIDGNSSLTDGGGIHCENSSNPYITDCTISNNMAGDDGGGIYCYESSPAITNCEFIENIADSTGGGIYCIHYSNPLIENCLFFNNSAFACAGILIASYCNPIINNCIFRENHSSYNAGGIGCFSQCSPEILNCLFNGNTATIGGGGMDIAECNPLITQCTFSEDFAYEGGEIFTRNSQPIINTSIIHGSISGEGIYFDNCPNSEIKYCDIYGNAGGAFGGEVPDDLGDLVTNNINGDPCDTYYNIFLEPHFIDPSNDDFHLLSTSPCIDAGNPLLPLDPDNTIADIGAFYFDQSSLGTIEGTVTLEGGEGNVHQVEVSANGYTTNPDEYGDYEITILPGTYNVTASLEGYIDSTITGVEVFEVQSTTGIDFILYSFEEPDIFIDPDSLAFGNVTIGDVSSIKSFYIFNQGNVDIDIFEISTPEAFEIKKGDEGDWVTNISDFTILDNSFQKIYVRFIPTDTGSYSGDISICSNDPDEDTVYVNVSGTGVEYAVPNIEINPTELQFGSVTISTSKEELFTISNTGSAELVIDSIYVPANSVFLIRLGDSGAYSNFISGFSILVENEKDIYVEFIPPAIGQYSTYITIKSNVGSDFVNVSGSGVEYDVPDIDVNPVELHFGGVSIYKSVEDTITIMNTGNAILGINNIFSLSGYEIKLDVGIWSNNIPAFDIPPLEEEIIYVKFHPEALISYNGFIYITSNDPDESSIPVLVEGQGIPVLSEKTPDAFTPNGDGLNDEFIIGPFQESGSEQAKFKVFDLHGKLIHETKGVSNEPLFWNGIDDSGNKSSSGAYIYVYLINNAVYKSGKIYLVR